LDFQAFETFQLLLEVVETVVFEMVEMDYSMEVVHWVAFVGSTEEIDVEEIVEEIVVVEIVGGMAVGEIEGIES